jgi:hypothetical protein
VGVFEKVFEQIVHALTDLHSNWENIRANLGKKNSWSLNYDPNRKISSTWRQSARIGAAEREWK